MSVLYFDAHKTLLCISWQCLFAYPQSKLQYLHAHFDTLIFGLSNILLLFIFTFETHMAHYKYTSQNLPHLQVSHPIGALLLWTLVICLIHTYILTLEPAALVLVSMLQISPMEMNPVLNFLPSKYMVFLY